MQQEYGGKAMTYRLYHGEALEGREIVSQRSPLLGAGIKVRPLRGDMQDAQSLNEMLELSEDRRARLMAFVEASTDMPEAVKTRLLGQLAERRVPARMVQRLERRMGG